MGLIIYVISLFVTRVISFPSDVKVFPQSIKECRPGEVIENDCNKCICSKRKVFECIPKKCNSLEIETSCRPDTIYVKDTTTCICNRFGKWPHQDCSNVFQNLADSKNCEPNSYVSVDCNVCRCDSHNKIDKNRCTKNPCKKHKQEARRHLGGGQVYGACEEKNWYSLAPCQFCYCVNENKLVCNTANSNRKQLELGSYKLNVCGKDILRDAFDLMPQNAKEVLRYGNNIKEEATEPVNLVNAEIESKVFGNDINNHQSISLPNDENDNINNQQAVSHPKNVNYDMSDSESKSSESEEDNTPHIRLQEYTAKPSTALIESAESTEKKREEKVSEGNYTDYSNEIPVEIKKEKPKVMAVNTIMKSEMDSIQTYSVPVNTNIHKKQKQSTLLKDTAEAESKDAEFRLPINLDLPGVLNKVFKMALKKSMVSIVEDAECKPGTTTAVNCNVCFCTTDAKMMCTNTECQ